MARPSPRLTAVTREFVGWTDWPNLADLRAPE